MTFLELTKKTFSAVFLSGALLASPAHADPGQLIAAIGTAALAWGQHFHQNTEEKTPSVDVTNAAAPSTANTLTKGNKSNKDNQGNSAQKSLSPVNKEHAMDSNETKPIDLFNKLKEKSQNGLEDVHQHLTSLSKSLKGKDLFTNLYKNNENTDSIENTDEANTHHYKKLSL